MKNTKKINKQVAQAVIADLRANMLLLDEKIQNKTKQNKNTCPP